MSTFHLAASLMTPGHFRNAWRLPHADPGAHRDIEHYRRLARIADEAGFDAIFVGDGPALSPDIAHAPAGGIDPLVLLTDLLAVTERVGAFATSSSTYNSPYNLARRFASLDIVSKGRAAVNVVTTYAPAAAANFGLAQPLDKETRYRRAHEFLDVVTRLWDAWEPDALVQDKASGVYADVDRIHTIDHEGEFFSVKGPLPGPTGPQGRPVIVQAGGSEGGRRLAADFAEVVFTVAQTQAGAVRFREEVRARAIAAGRSADDVKVSLGVIVLVGDDEDDVARRQEELLGTVPLAERTREFLAALGIPDHDPDAPIRAADLPAELSVHGSAGFQASTRALAVESGLSARELVRTSVGLSSGGHRLLVGTPQTIADDLEAWWRVGAADGFTIMYADTSVDFELFARQVVPLLTERGLLASAPAGATLRERLGSRPPTTLSVSAARSG